MKYLFCDLETFSEVDLRKCGAHRYAEDPSTRVLLWGFALDDGPAQVWDVASGVSMPYDLRIALDEVKAGTRKTVWHNGMNFDVNVLHKVMGVNIPPEAVIDTMVLAYECALPGSLADLSAIFHLEKEGRAKDADGHRLLMLFSKPQPANRKVKRCTAVTHPEDWKNFIEYCRRDIEAERALFHKIPKFNFSKAERALQALDARINNRGMAIDLDLARAAVQIAAEQKEALNAKTAGMTGGRVTAATQTQAMLDEIERAYGVRLKSLQKAEVARLVESDDIPEPLRELLRVRLTSAKAAVRKFQTLIDATCKDGRLRGTLQFRGAGRTGRFCLTGDHEVLTRDGWVRLDQWQGGKIAVWNIDSELISFQDSEALEFDYAGPMYAFSTVRCAQISTPDHKMPYMTKSGRWEADTVENLAKRSRINIPFTGFRRAPTTIEHDLLRVLIMTQADGFYTDDGQVSYQFKKLRKVKRCKMLLRRVGIPFVVSKSKGDVFRIGIRSRDVPLWLRLFKGKEYGFWLLNESADVIFDELPEWDGNRCGPNSIQYCTKVKHNADLIQALAILSGRTATILERAGKNEKWATCYAVNIWNTPGKAHEMGKPAVLDFSGKVYCASTPTGFFVVRRNGRVWITGNSGRLVQPQNLARPSMSNDEIEFAIGAAKDGTLPLFYPNNALEALSNCLRGAIIVPPGKRMVVADYSNIEGRVLAWLANETWKLDAFRAYDAGVGHDLYKMTYAKSFNVPVESVTKEQRQMGKVLELAMGYGGGPGAFVTFARGYGIDLQSMAEAVLPVVPSAVMSEAVSAYEWARAQPARLCGLSRDVWLACDSLKRLWRKANARIVDFWRAVGEAAVKAIQNRGYVIRVPNGHGITAQIRGAWLLIRLPSGRYLCYASPRLEDERALSWSSMGVNQKTHKWQRLETYPGKCVENVTQAVACDILTAALPRLEEAGFKTILTIHDEVLTECPDTDEFTHERMEALMCELPAWAEGLPLAAAGFNAYRYRK